MAALRVDGNAYGLARHLPGACDGAFEYLAAVEVRSTEGLPNDMVAWEVPALTYAVLPANDVPGIAPVCDWFYQTWLPQSTEYEMDAPLLLEVYPESYPQDGIIQLHFPVRRKP